LRAELDYLREGRNAERFAHSFASDPDVQIPTVFWETTTSRLITLERIRGMKVTDLDALDAAGIDRHLLAQRATRVMAKMVFEDGFFHADPHPGNFFIQSEGRIGIIDFGTVGTVSDHLRAGLRRLMFAVVSEDSDRLADAVLGLSASKAPVDRAQLRADLEALLAQYSGRSLRDVGLGEVTGEILEIVRRHHLSVPRDLALLLKAFIMDEGMAEALDPQFRLLEALTPSVYRHLTAELSPAALARRAEQFGADLAEVAANLPGQLHRIFEVVADGGVEVHLRAAELEPMVARTERLANRIAASVLAAAVIDGLAELTAADRRVSGTRRTRTLPVVLAGVGALTAFAAGRRTNRVGPRR
ncbi:MAG: AarF/ABC1/UbiB kinase family protein, partial [Solirubrobacterales bacterium]|nr:AarF/ABC1/UbiB kinase family protein [Solirubrobacterales bacterium]